MFFEIHLHSHHCMKLLAILNAHNCAPPPKQKPSCKQKLNQKWHVYPSQISCSAPHITLYPKHDWVQMFYEFMRSLDLALYGWLAHVYVFLSRSDVLFMTVLKWEVADNVHWVCVCLVGRSKDVWVVCYFAQNFSAPSSPICAVDLPTSMYT